MNIFTRLRNGLFRFMYGRNGMDSLNWALFLVQLALSVSVSWIDNKVVFNVMYTLTMALWFLLLFRMLSRNLAKRRAENARFSKWWLPLKGRFVRMKDRQHKYFTCPGCKTVCRVPRGKGTIEITCPKCRGSIRGKS